MKSNNSKQTANSPKCAYLLLSHASEHYPREQRLFFPIAGAAALTLQRAGREAGIILLPPLCSALPRRFELHSSRFIGCPRKYGCGCSPRRAYTAYTGLVSSVFTRLQFYSYLRGLPPILFVFARAITHLQFYSYLRGAMCGFLST